MAFFKQGVTSMFKFASDIRPSTIYIKVNFSSAMMIVIKHCIVTVLCIFFEYTVGPADLDLLLCSSDSDIN